MVASDVECGRYADEIEQITHSSAIILRPDSSKRRSGARSVVILALLRRIRGGMLGLTGLFLTKAWNSVLRGCSCSFDQRKDIGRNIKSRKTRGYLVHYGGCPLGDT